MSFSCAGQDPQHIPVQLEPINKGTPPAGGQNAQPLYQARFNDPGSWPHGSNPAVDYGCKDGTYRIERRGDAAFGWYAYVSPDDFACEVAGRVPVGQPGDGWGLAVTTGDPGKEHGIQFMLRGDGTVKVAPSIWESDKELGPNIHSGENAAIKTGTEWNNLLVVVRGRRVEAYVNGVAVLKPFNVDRVITPAKLALIAFGPGNNSLAEFQRFTVWPADHFPPAGR